MNWFDTSGLTSLAKTALKEAQKTIDKALDIQDEPDESPATTSQNQPNQIDNPGDATPSKDTSDFFSSWGLTVSAEISKDELPKEPPIITESPSKSYPQSIWGSFAGSFFEHPTDDGSDTTIVQAPKAKPLNTIADDRLSSSDESFSRSKLIMAEGEVLSTIEEARDKINKSDECKSKIEERRSSSRSNCLSLMSSESGRNSSDSVEVLGSHSLKSTPDSELASTHSMSHSSSAGQKLNSESVEILPDSLVSPSSIECLGFDSCSSSNEYSSTNISPSNEHSSDKKSTPLGERTELAGGSADSVSLVADDDDDTISYNSVSECTAPTVFDTNGEEKLPLSPNPRSSAVRIFTEIHKTRYTDSKELSCVQEFVHSIPTLPTNVVQLSENSSNDGSWSDRTLNPDNDSLIAEVTLDDHSRTKEVSETEAVDDMFMDKLSDSSSFYNVTVTTDLLQSDSSAFVNVEKPSESSPADGSASSQKDNSPKERISPISSDSRSDLVKIGSDRTSGHTSGDELETATSSDIEIIPSPNGDNMHGFCRQSPAKYGQFKHSKLDGATSPNLVDLVLGKSLATKIRGHNRELSEASVQSNTSDESQGSENDRLMRRLCEMAEILEARENRLMEVSRNNAELAENNADLKGQVESLMAKHEVGDINMITEDYTQRMSALEKKFQQAIRERDQLRKQLDTMKSELLTRKASSEFETTVKEKDEMITQLQEEGEKLARQQLTQSNIIKKLRVKEKENEQCIKSLRDKVAELTSELDRLKRSISAKEAAEASQIETVYRLTSTNKRLEAELAETRSSLDDTTQRLETNKTSLEAARRELAELRGSSAELARRRDVLARLQQEKEQADTDNERLQSQLDNLRAKMVQEASRWAAREENVRRELAETRAAGAAQEARAEGPGGGGGALLAQLAALQQSALEREQAHRARLERLVSSHAMAETKLAKAVVLEQSARERCAELQEQLDEARGAAEELDSVKAQCHRYEERLLASEEQIHLKTMELERLRAETAAEVSDLKRQLVQTEKLLQAERDTLDAEKRRNAILQEQLTARAGDVSPPQSVASDSLSASLWTQEDGSDTGIAGGGAGSVAGALGVCGVEELLARLQRREGELRALTARGTTLAAERRALADQLADACARLQDFQGLQEQYDALLQMYGEKEEQLQELRLDLQDVTQLYKAQLDELIALRRRTGDTSHAGT